MKNLFLSMACLVPALAFAQEAAAPEEPPRKFVCSVVKSSEGEGGRWSGNFNEDEDGRPDLVYVPADNDPVEEWFSEDRRYYHYIREYRDAEGRLGGTVMGTFDLRQADLSVVRVFFGSGQDSVRRTFATTARWKCTEFDQLR